MYHLQIHQSRQQMYHLQIHQSQQQQWMRRTYHQLGHLLGRRGVRQWTLLLLK